MSIEKARLTVVRSDKQQLSGKGGDRKTLRADPSKAGQPVCMGPYETALCASRPGGELALVMPHPGRGSSTLCLRRVRSVVQSSQVLVLKQENERRRLGA